MAERLQKILARAGVASRRKAEEMILAGRVSVGGQVVSSLGVQAESGDDVRVDGRLISAPEEKRYIMLHKPEGYVTTVRDPQGRPTVKSLVAGIPLRLYPVGRLDYDSEGLLLMTNDGDFAYGLQHPRFQVPKTYRVQLAGQILPSDLDRLAAGVALGDGPFRPACIRCERVTRDHSWLQLTITEGRNRIIRRAMDQMGYRVCRLIRLKIGDLRLGSLKKGEFRDLTRNERETLAIFLKKFS
jgi:23S rRNA pseudouridine2605 synthase